MIRRPPRSTRTDTLFPYTTLFRSTPLWALDLLAGALIARSAPATRPLPPPGAVRAEALRPELWSRERAIITAEAAGEAAQRLSDQLAVAHARVQIGSASCRERVCQHV